MKLSLDIEKVLKTPGEKTLTETRKSAPFAAEISEGDKHLDGIIEKDVHSKKYKQVKNAIEEECEL